MKKSLIIRTARAFCFVSTPRRRLCFVARAVLFASTVLLLIVVQKVQKVQSVYFASPCLFCERVKQQWYGRKNNIFSI